jgi:hypothetical protein
LIYDLSSQVYEIKNQRTKEKEAFRLKAELLM